MSISVGLVNKTTHKTTLATNIAKSVMNIGGSEKPFLQVNDSVVPGLGGRKAQTATLVIQAQADTDYLLTDKGTGQLPDAINVTRSGSDLWIYTDPDKDEPDIIIKDYYLYKGDILAETSNGGAVIYQAESGLHADTLSTSSVATLVQAEAADTPVSWGAGVAEVDAGWLLLGALGIGGGVALAVNQHNKSDDKSGSGRDTDQDKENDAALKVDSNNSHGIAGRGVAGSTIIILDSKGEKVATTKVDNKGNWAITGSNPLKEGESGKIYVKYEDGRESAKTELTGGKQTIPDEPVITDNTEFYMAGTTAKGTSVRVVVSYSSGDKTYVATVKPDGTWFIKDPLPDGAQVKVIAKDAAGNDSTPVIIRVGDNSVPLGASVQENGESLSGIGPENCKIVITDANGKLLATTTTDGSGKWTFATNPLAGGKTGIIQVVDHAGRESAKQTIEGGKSAELPSPIIVTNNSKGLSGKGTPGTTIKVKGADGTVLGETKVNDKGEWKFDKNPLEDGKKGTITASEEGHTDSKSTELDSGDRTPPKEPVVTENNSKYLSGTGEPGTGIIFKDSNNVIIGKARVDGDGHWKVEPNPFNEGTKGTMTGKDTAGNVSAEVAVESGAKLPPESPEITENSAGKLSGTGTAGTVVLIKNSKGEVLQKIDVKADGTWSSEPNPLKAGDKGTICSTDKLGNEGSAYSVTGGHSPVKGAALSLAEDTGISAHDNITSNGKILVKEMTGAKYWEYSVNGGKTWLKGSGSDFTLKHGTYDDNQVQVRYFDKDDNASRVTKFDKVVIDTEAPAAVSLTYNNGKMVLGKLESGAEWEYTLDGGKSWLKGKGDNFQLEQGEYQSGMIGVRQTDAAGNTSNVSKYTDAITVGGKAAAADATDHPATDFHLSDDAGVTGRLLKAADQYQTDEHQAGEQTPQAASHDNGMQDIVLSELFSGQHSGGDITALLPVSHPAVNSPQAAEAAEIIQPVMLHIEALPVPVDTTPLLTEHLPLY